MDDLFDALAHIEKLRERAKRIDDETSVRWQDLAEFNEEHRFGRNLNLEQLKGDAIKEAMRRAGNKKAEAAKLLGVSYNGLCANLRKMRFE